jgi:hypothetical protein
MPPGSKRDPLSVAFDRGARALLQRAYDHPGQWQATRVAVPSPRQATALRQRGINPYGPDPVPKGGGLDARTRWMRGFIRALYYQHKWWSGGGGRQFRSAKRTTARHTGALIVEVGRVMPARGVIPAGRVVRVQLARGGQAKSKAVDRMPEREQWANDGPRRAQLVWRDW